ncbi:peptidylprolyl isomerase [Roseicyclus mahoneyensis]|uniref:Parvulin-like PPIase n=1 Tax=Roseicyclus mahoneyensis TaxID=164332 RepID=A0A316GHL1_9RHOB|nr:peptidylprolyl isomerase [Roseicyclus mahoneyensis]PWK60441.1 periplasmic chaperone for outer membrane proteins SurA [Roseicyclus mahoneyensis]
MIQIPQTPIRRFLRMLALAAPLALPAVTASAQSPFSAAVRVNDSIVTWYEIDQRALFLEVLRAPGDLRAEALETLVNERLQVAEARRVGALASPEEIEAGVEEFAARADLGAEQFIRAIGEEGVAPETFRDFVANGISWRNVVRRRFGARVQITDADIDEALQFTPRLDGATILLAEIVVPRTPENEETLRSELARLAADLNFDTETFSEAARRFSAATTRENDGLTGWRPLNAVPPQLREDMVLLAFGETYGPVSLGPAIAIFQMRGLSEGAYRAQAVTSVDYVTVPLPSISTEDGAAAAAALRADIDVCDDLYGQRPGAFERFDQPLGAIPGDIAMALAALDAGEMSFSVTRNAGTTTLAVMLCARNVAEPEAGRDALRQQLIVQQLEGYADALLEELRADAIITYE